MSSHFLNLIIPLNSDSNFLHFTPQSVTEIMTSAHVKIEYLCLSLHCFGSVSLVSETFLASGSVHLCHFRVQHFVRDVQGNND